MLGGFFLRWTSGSACWIVLPWISKLRFVCTLVRVSKGTANRRDRITTSAVGNMDDDSRAMRVPDCVRGIGTMRS